MKKWMYLIVPGILLAVFLSFYFPDIKRADLRLQQQKEAVARQRAEQEHQRAVLEAKARADSLRREEQNARDVAARQAQIDAEHKRQRDEVQAQINSAQNDIANYSKQAAELQLQLDKLNAEKDRLSREDFDLAKAVQMAAVTRSNEDLQIQRMVDIIANRASQSVLAQPPPAPQAR